MSCHLNNPIRHVFKTNKQNKERWKITCSTAQQFFSGMQPNSPPCLYYGRSEGQWHSCQEAGYHSGRDQPSLLASRLLILSYIWLVGVYVHLKTHFFFNMSSWWIFFSVNCAINFSFQLQGICCHAWSSLCFLAPGHTVLRNISPFWCYVFETFPLLIISGFSPETALEKCNDT